MELTKHRGRECLNNIFFDFTFWQKKERKRKYDAQRYLLKAEEIKAKRRARYKSKKPWDFQPKTVKEWNQEYYFKKWNNFPLNFSSHTHALKPKSRLSVYKIVPPSIGESETLTKEQVNAHERQKRKDQAWRRIGTILKRPVKGSVGYKLDTWREERTHEQLFNTYGEKTTLTGKHLGKGYHASLDFDIDKPEFSSKLKTKLRNEFNYLLNKWNVWHDSTKKGGHVDIITSEPLKKEAIEFNYFGKIINVGSIQGIGDYVVDVDANKKPVRGGKWYLKGYGDQEFNREKLKSELGYFTLSGDRKQQQIINKKPITNIKPSETIKTTQNIGQLAKNAIITIKSKILRAFELLINGNIYHRYNIDQSPKYFLFNTNNGSASPPFQVGQSYQLTLKGTNKHPFYLYSQPCQY